MRLAGPSGDQYRAIKDDILSFMERCVRDHGDLVAFTAAGRPWVLVNDPVAVHQILTEPFERVTVGPSLVPGKRTMGHSIMMNYESTWRARRAVIQRPLTHSGVRRFGGLISHRARELAGAWSGRSDVDLYPQMRTVVLAIVAEALFSWNVDEAVTQIHAVGRAFRANYFELWFVGPRAADPAFEAAIAEYDSVMYRIIRERRGRDDPGDDLLGMLIQARDGDGEQLDDEWVRDEANTLLFAGHGTTALALTYAFFLMAGAPDVQQRLRDQVREVAGSRAVEADDLENIALARAVVEEALRLYPVAYFQDRTTVADVRLGNAIIPARTDVMISPWAMHRDERSFRDPLSFDPDRFMPDRRREIPKYAFIPFGGGQKICVGNHLALLEAALILATVIQRLELAPGDAHRHPIPPQLLQPAGTLGVPEGGLHVRVRPVAN